MARLMRTSFLALGLVLFLFFQVQAEDKSNPRLITVTGEGEVKVVPNEIILTLGVETNNKNLAAAKNENDQTLQKIIATVKKLGIEDKYIQTDYINIEPRYEHEWENRQFIGYFVRKSMSITLRDVSKFEALLSGVLDVGANYIHGIDFRTTELRKYRDQARSLAVKAAQEKANDLAKQLRQTVGKPHMIQEYNIGGWFSYHNWWGARGGSQMMQNVVQDGAASSGAGDGTIALGQISIKAQVTVSFELE
jgi:uncharacterized protein YggE